MPAANPRSPAPLPPLPPCLPPSPHSTALQPFFSTAAFSKEPLADQDKIFREHVRALLGEAAAPALTYSLPADVLPAGALRDLFEQLDKAKRRHAADVAEITLTDFSFTRADLGAASMRKAFERNSERRRAAAEKAALLSPSRAAATAAIVTGRR